MAVTTWNSAGSTSWNTAGNWNTLAVPTAEDDVVFDATSVVPCTCDVAIDVASLTVAAGYSGTLDFADSAYSHAIGGNATFDGVGTVDCGNATITVSGNFDCEHETTWTCATSTLVFAGNGNLTGKHYYTSTFYNLTVNAGVTATVTWHARGEYGGTLTNNGTINLVNALIGIPGGVGSQVFFYGSAVVLGNNSSITGAGLVIIAVSSTITRGTGVTIDCGQLTFMNCSCTLPAGVYGSGLVKVGSTGAGNTTLYLAAGSFTFSGSLEIENTSNLSTTLDLATNAVTDITVNGNLIFDLDSTGGITVTNSGRAVAWTIQGDVIDEVTGAGAVAWTKGTETITLSGTNDQNVNFLDLAVEDIVYNKTAGDLTLTGGVTTDSFTGTSTGTGTFDPNGQSITTIGNCNWAADFDFNSAADCLNGCAWVIGGDFTCNGQTLNATAAWDLTVTGSAVASGVGSVAYSDASGGTKIDASAGPWTKDVNTLNWNVGGDAFFPFHVRRQTMTQNSLIGR